MKYLNSEQLGILLKKKKNCELTFKCELLEGGILLFVLGCMFSAWCMLNDQQIIIGWKNECKP